VEKNDPQTKLEKQMQALTQKIETHMRAQAQVPITTPPFKTYDRCGIVPGPGECTVDDELVIVMIAICFYKVFIKQICIAIGRCDISK